MRTLTELQNFIDANTEEPVRYELHKKVKKVLASHKAMITKLNNKLL